MRSFLSKHKSRIAAVIALVIAGVLPLLLGRFLTASNFATWERILILSAAFSIAALGLNIIVGYCGLLNLGFAAFMLIGAYTTGILMKEYKWPFWLAMLASVAHGGFWGIVLGLPTLRLTGDYFAIVTFGLSELVKLIAQNWVEITRGTKGYPGVPRPTLFGYEFKISPTQDSYWYLVVGLLALCMLMTSRLSRSRLGRAWRALREDEVAAEACGINSMWYKTIAFAVSASMGALSGSFLAAFNTMVDYRVFDFMMSVFVLCYIVLGGMGTVVGPVLGAFVLTIISEQLRKSPFENVAGAFRWWPAAHNWLEALPWVPDMRMILFGVILIIMIRFRPEGLFPSRSRARELHGVDRSESQGLFDLRSQ